MEKCCVMLPTGKLFDRIFDEGITPISSAAGIEFIRLSTALTEANVSTNLQALRSSGALIADLTGRNPNVMFHCGCARGLQKPTIYITQSAEDFPFPLPADPIVYGADANFLRAELTSRLMGRNESAPGGQDNGDARERFLSIFGDLLKKHGYQHHGPIRQESGNVFTLLEQDMDLPLVQDIARRARELNLRVKLM